MEPEIPEAVWLPDVATSPHPRYDELPPFSAIPRPESVADEEEDMNAKEFPPPNVPIPPDPRVRPREEPDESPL
ncbi:hypothetical protein [Zavarzinella formosa]|uniref:hypothetical protein n=1 Tax=Zavarzinella formosa TaxID=360055 RepID=UPI0002DE4C71|nr:hypothetical protein [Zavarzinella formosa]